MNIIRKLMSRTRPLVGRLHRIRGLSTAELVGIIVIVGILGALGGSYIIGLVNQADTNAISQNVATLNTVAASAVAGGATVGAGAQNNIDVTSSTTMVGSLNTGFTINGVSYKVSPAVPTPASYTGTYNAGPPVSVTFVATAGATSP